MSTESLAACVISTGRAGMIHARNLANNIPNARLVALADVHGDGLRKAGTELGIKRKYADYRKALDDKDVEAVFVVHRSAPGVVEEDPKRGSRRCRTG